jgi:hypothetical protein
VELDPRSRQAEPGGQVQWDLEVPRDGLPVLGDEVRIVDVGHDGSYASPFGRTVVANASAHPGRRLADTEVTRVRDEPGDSG